jgi:hypothetical protein
MATTFKSSYLGMAYEMLVSYEKQTWNTHSFDEFKYSRRDIISFFNALVMERAIVRSTKRGPHSEAIFSNPHNLLNMCVAGFRDNVIKRFMYISKESHEQIIKNLVDKEIKFYLGGFRGLRGGLRDSYDNTLTVILPGRSWFKGFKQYNLRTDLRITKIYGKGDIEFILPKYHKFLEHEKYQQQENGINIPSDFYSYLSMKSSKDPMVLHQATHMENILQNQHGSFLFWMGR